MIPQPPGNGETRRQFIKKTGTVAAMVVGAGMLDVPAWAGTSAATIGMVLDEKDTDAVSEAPVAWAVDQLRGAFQRRGLVTQMFAKPDQVPPGMECIIATAQVPDMFRNDNRARGKVMGIIPESLAIARVRTDRYSPEARQFILAAGADARGLVYALLELADRATYADDPLAMLKSLGEIAIVECPANPIRSVARAFVSDVEDKSWFQDREFWMRYLTLLATQRFNRFHLMLGVGYDFTTGITDCYFHFAYPFLLAVPGYDVRARPLPDAERDVNLEMLRFISDEAARRGLHFQLGIWTHAYQWTNSPKANYIIEGLTPEKQGPYCRDALRAVLAACPNIKGVTFRIHGESGVPEGNYDLWKTIFDGVAQCGRKVEIDMHAKGMDQGMIEVALATGQAVNISPKSWAEHMGLPYMQGAIRSQELPPANARTSGFFSRSSGARSFLRYGYGDLLVEGRSYGVLHRMWPGTQRLLAWADPETAAAYGRVSSFCGCLGLELMEPLTFKGRKGSGLAGGRDGYIDASLKPAYDFEKYEFYYRAWGRGLYNPEGERDGIRRPLSARFGSGAEAVAGALAAAGKILPLVTTAHCPSAANNNYWPEMYYPMPIVEATHKHPYSDSPSPKRLGTVSPLDPEFFLGIDEFADELLTGKPSGKFSPALVAARLEAASAQATKQLRQAKWRAAKTRGAEFRRLSGDIAIQAGLGRFFAAKFRAGVLFALYQRTLYRNALKQAIESNRSARAAWAELAAVAKRLYRDDIAFGPDYFQRGHWQDRLPVLDTDIADMVNLLARSDGGAEAPLKMEPHAIEGVMAAVFDHRTLGGDPSKLVRHTPVATFRRGQPLEINGSILLSSIERIELRYRHVNQSEHWQVADMTIAKGTCGATIPAEYTDSSFPLQYYFRIHDAAQTVLAPGFEPGWNGQPYYVVRQG